MLTLDIRHIHYTALLHALATAACRHAERAPESYADDLYRVSRQLNDIGLYIQNTNLHAILNSALPLPASIDPIIDADDSPAASIVELLRQHPNGLTNAQIADQLGQTENTIASHTRRATESGLLTYRHDTNPYKTKIYTLTPATPAQAPTPSGLIIAALRNSAPLTGIQIADRTKLQPGLVHKHIKTLVDADIIHHTNNTVPYTYTLTHQTHPATPPAPPTDNNVHPALTGKDGAPDRILKLLIDAGPSGLTGHEIASQIHYDYNVTMTNLSRLHKAGHITKTNTRPTRYSLITQAAHAAD